jgi:hypothetical protein
MQKHFFGKAGTSQHTFGSILFEHDKAYAAKVQGAYSYSFGLTHQHRRFITGSAASGKFYQMYDYGLEIRHLALYVCLNLYIYVTLLI